MIKFKLDKNLSKKMSVYVAMATMSLTAVGCNNEDNAVDYKPTQASSNAESVNSNLPVQSVGIDLSNLGINLSTLGDELSPKAIKNDVKVTGNVNPETIVNGNGVNYVDEEALNKSNNVGKTIVDTNNGQYYVTNDGKVKENETGNNIVDGKGNTTYEGSSNIPEGYVYDEEQKAYVEKEEAGKYVTLTSNYYDKNGNLVFENGELVSKDAYASIEEDIKNGKLTKTKVEKVEPTKEAQTEEVKKEEGKTNSNGTYSIYGLTFETKADYDQWVIQGYEGYVEVDGIMMSYEAFIELQNSLQK